MKNATLCLLAVGIMALLAYPASAGTIDNQDQITLGGTASQKVFAFTGDGAGGFSLNLSGVRGSAVGQGTLFSNGLYSILQNGASIFSNSTCPASAPTCTFGLTQVGNVMFNYGKTYTNGSLLSGFLQLMSITQTASTKTGLFNESLVINLTNLSGTLASKFTTGGGIVQITLDFLTSTKLQSLGLGKQAFAGLHTGSVNPTIPEPASLALIGGGLLALAGLGIKKNLFAH
jgi:hypothetical protein